MRQQDRNIIVFGNGFMENSRVVVYGGALENIRRTSTTTYAYISHTKFSKRCLKIL